MKRLIVLSLALISCTLLSCSSDDDGGVTQEPKDQFIGSWKVNKISENGVDEQLSVCKLRSTLEVKEGGTMEEVDFFIDMNSNCVSEKGTAAWKKLEGNSYEITPQDDEDNEPFEVQIVFTENSFTLTTKFEDDGDEIVIVSVYTKNN